MAHAVGDALDFPIYGSHYLLTFPFLDADGDPTSAAAGLDSEVSKDLGTFADCTNEATEIATNSGSYYLYLTGAEMTAKIVTVQVKTSSSGVKTMVFSIPTKRLPIMETGTAQAGAAGTITLASGASDKDSYYNGWFVRLSNNTPSGVQYATRRIISYVGSTRVATIESNWGTNPDNTTTYELMVEVTASVAGWAGASVTSPLTAGVPEVNVKSSGSSSAVPGASGGLLISGSNTGTITFGALTVTGATTLTGNVAMAAGLTITQSTSNASAIVITGNGTGHGIIATSGSGATGDGIKAVAASTNGNGFNIVGSGTGTGFLSTGGATGPGAKFVGGGTSGNSIDQTVTSGTAYIAANVTHADGVAWNSNSITSNTIATDAIDAASIKADAVTKIQNGLATAAQINSLAVNTRANISVPVEIETPDASTLVYKIRVHLFDVEGNMEAPDSTPTIALTNAAGTDRSSRLSSASNPSTGVYTWDYTATAGDAEEQLVWVFTVVEGGLTRTYPATSYVVEESAYRFSSTDRSNLSAIKAKTDNLPSDPADQSQVDAGIASVVGIIGTPLFASVSDDINHVYTKVDTEVAAIKAQTDLITSPPYAITSNVKKNQALAAFEFLMTNSTTHAPATGATVTVTRSIDGGAFAAGTLSAVTEVANGIYAVDFGAGDMNGNVIVLRATATGCDDALERIITQP